MVITMLSPVNIEAKSINKSKVKNTITQTEYIHNFAKAKQS